jgi:catalase
MIEEEKQKRLTRAFGVPVGDHQNSETTGPRGSVLMQDVHLPRKLGHFARGRIPGRMVNAEDAGAPGQFEVAGGVTKYTKAKFLGRIARRQMCSSCFPSLAERRNRPMQCAIPEGSHRSPAWKTAAVVL